MNLLNDIFIKKAKHIHKDMYDYSLINYINASTPIEIKCKIHGSFYQTPSKHLQGRGCTECGRNKSHKKNIKDTEYYLLKFSTMYGHRFKYPSYIQGAKTYFEAICSIHGSFTTTPNAHLKGGGCPMCDNKYSTPYTREEFINKAQEKFTYDFSKIDFINMHTRITLTCPLHEDFEIVPISLICGKGCPICTPKLTRRSTTASFISKATKLHGNYYDYSRASYERGMQLIEIGCPTHGFFHQTPHAHLAGKGCTECAIEKGTFKKKLTLEEFITRSNIVHNYLYDYSDTVYKNAHSKINIICNTHGVFKQLAMNHIKGIGCPKCYSSLIVNKIRDLLEELNLKYEYNNRTIIKPKEIDFFIPSLNIGIEVNDTWTHNSEFNPFGKPKDKFYHQNKTKRAWMKNVKLLHLFEKDIENISLTLLNIKLINLLNASPSFIEPRSLPDYDVLIYDDGTNWRNNV